MTDTTPPDPPDHPAAGAPSRAGAATDPGLAQKSAVRAALRRQIDENLRAAFGAVLAEPCPDHLADLLGRLAAGGGDPGATDGTDTRGDLP